MFILLLGKFKLLFFLFLQLFLLRELIAKLEALRVVLDTFHFSLPELKHGLLFVTLFSAERPGKLEQV